MKMTTKRKFLNSNNINNEIKMADFLQKNF